MVVNGKSYYIHNEDFPTLEQVVDQKLGVGQVMAMKQCAEGGCQKYHRNQDCVDGVFIFVEAFLDFHVFSVYDFS